MALLHEMNGTALSEPAQRHVKEFRAQSVANNAIYQPVTAEELLALSDADLVQRLKMEPASDCKHAWAAATQREPERALELLPA